jgi:hypothetical protein
MHSARRIGIAVMTAALAAGPLAGHADTPPKRGADAPVDERLLEFLGSADPATDSGQPADGSWLTYLSQVNIGKVAATSRAPAAPAQPKAADPAAPAAKPGG